jgi:hypothetical protein
MPIIIVESEKSYNVRLNATEAKAVLAAVQFVYNQLAPTYDGGEKNTYEPVLSKVIDALYEADENVADNTDDFEFSDDVDLTDIDYALQQVKE